jgi:hypothetical protein
VLKERLSGRKEPTSETGKRLFADSPSLLASRKPLSETEKQLPRTKKQLAKAKKGLLETKERLLRLSQPFLQHFGRQSVLTKALDRTEVTTSLDTKRLSHDLGSPFQAAGG